MESLLFTINAVLPIILCILAGYLIKLLKIFPDSFWSILNKLCFRFLLPVLLFKNIYDIESITMLGENWKAMVYGAAAIVSVFFIGLVVVMFSVKDDKQKGVVLQCIFRSNYAIIGIGLIELLASPSTLVAAKGVGAVIAAISIPVYNVLAILALTIFLKDETGKKISIKETLIKICKNPLIIGVVSGIIVLCFRALIPQVEYVTKSVVTEAGVDIIKISTKMVPKFTFRYFTNYGGSDSFIYTTIKYLAQASSPVALVALGGGFSFSAVKRLKNQIILGTLFRTMLVPGVCLTIAYFLKFDAIYFPAFIALFGTPVAVSSAPMSSEMQNDGELAGQLVVWTTLASAFTLFIIIFICRAIGII